MTKEIYVLGTNELVGLIVEEVYRSRLSSADWKISGIYQMALREFVLPQSAVLVVDRRLTDSTIFPYKTICDSTNFVVPFDESDFENIHDSFNYLLNSPDYMLDAYVS